MAAIKPADVGSLQVLEIDGDELLTVFAEVMAEWGHHRTAAGLRFPTLDEAQRAARRRDPGRGRNTTPLP